MLRFERLKITNFGPFKGEQSIEFTQNNGVTIVWGYNGRGKTSLLNVFRYALFGYVKYRRGTTTDYIALTNEEAKSDGKYGFSISLKMSNDGDNYTLKRGVHLRDGIYTPSTNEDFIEDFFLKKNGTILSVSDRDHEIKQIMPPDISRFFLFDGELLQEYETLLDDTSDEGRVIKSSIEKILGMPVLTNAKADISDLVSSYITAKNKAAQNDKNTADYANKIDALLAEIDGHKAEMDRLERELESEQNNCASIQKKMDDTDKLRTLLSRETVTDQTLKKAEADRDELRASLQSAMKNAWQGMVSPTIQKLISELQAEVNKLNAKKTEVQASHTILSEMEKAISDHHCEVCDQNLTDEWAHHLQMKLDDLKSSHPALTEDERTSLDLMQKKISALRGVKLNVDVRSIQATSDSLNRIEIQISNLAQELSDIEKQIRTFGDYDPSVASLTTQYSKSQAKIAELRAGITKERKAKEDAEIKREKLDAKVTQLSKNKDVLTATERLKICQQIENIFGQGIEKYRVRLKESVEADASSLFVNMSSDEDYERLQINDNYGLEIIHKAGKKVPGRSAGFEHVVALSLIGALHKNAPLQGPVIMDSLFGRLDPTHKRNVTKTLPKLSDQVILLVYDGEIDPNQTREILGGNLIKEYRLNRVTSFNTKID